MEHLINDRLKQHGLRNTPVRKQVLSIFYDVSGTALANRDIEDQLNTLDRITLYRTLKTFEQNGIVHQVIDGTGVSKYALCSDHCSENEHHDVHAHFCCIKCDQTVCLEDIKVTEPILSEGFEIKSSQLVLRGICNQCTL